jgi:hypothetical protein
MIYFVCHGQTLELTVPINYEEKSFVTLTPDINVVQFFLLLKLSQNKLVCYIHASEVGSSNLQILSNTDFVCC